MSAPLRVPGQLSMQESVCIRISMCKSNCRGSILGHESGGLEQIDEGMYPPQAKVLSSSASPGAEENTPRSCCSDNAMTLVLIACEVQLLTLTRRQASGLCGDCCLNLIRSAQFQAPPRTNASVEARKMYVCREHEQSGTHATGRAQNSGGRMWYFVSSPCNHCMAGSRSVKRQIRRTVSFA